MQALFSTIFSNPTFFLFMPASVGRSRSFFSGHRSKPYKPPPKLCFLFTAITPSVRDCRFLFCHGHCPFCLRDARRIATAASVQNFAAPASGFLFVLFFVFVMAFSPTPPILVGSHLSASGEIADNSGSDCECFPYHFLSHPGQKKAPIPWGPSAVADTRVPSVAPSPFVRNGRRASPPHRARWLPSA